MARERQALLALPVAGLALLVVFGYTLDLGWTGFPGNRLWDRLELLVLPLAVSLLPIWSELARGVRTRHGLIAVCVTVALLVTIVGGYSSNSRGPLEAE